MKGTPTIAMGTLVLNGTRGPMDHAAARVSLAVRSVATVLAAFMMAACVGDSSPTDPTSPPPPTLEVKLTANDAASDDRFGSSVSIKGDLAIVGARVDDDAGFSSGSAYVFRRTGTGWSQEAKLTASDAAAFDHFGGSVSIDGDLAIVGALSDKFDGEASSGSAYVFRRNGTSWIEEAKLTVGDAAAREKFGSSVAISGDLAIVGAYSDDDAGTDSGSAYIFRRTGTIWIEEAKLTASDAAADDRFGNSVSIDGDLAIVGARLDDDAGASSGSAYVFRRTGTSWIEEAKLTASDAARFDRFGSSVSINGDLATVGAPVDDGVEIDSGSAYVFRRTGTSWIEEAKLTASDAAPFDQFGFSVSISGDLAIVGAFGDDYAGGSFGAGAGGNSGSAYFFRRTGTSWIEDQKLTASDAAPFDQFGFSVSVSGNLAIVGAFADDDAGPDSGSAYVYDTTALR